MANKKKPVTPEVQSILDRFPPVDDQLRAEYGDEFIDELIRQRELRPLIEKQADGIQRCTGDGEVHCICDQGENQ